LKDHFKTQSLMHHEAQETPLLFGAFAPLVAVRIINIRFCIYSVG